MSPSSSVSEQKERLRSRFRTRRCELDADAARQSSQQVCRQLRDSGLLDGVTTVAGYMARGREVDLQPLFDDLLSQGIRLLFPRVIGRGQMEFCPVDDWSQLQPGAFGIDEPTTDPGETAGVELFVVPGLAFDRQGTRLGFGMGYYDRALPPVGQATAVGVGHNWQFVDQLPGESHDRPMDYIVTADGWHRVQPAEPSSRE